MTAADRRMFQRLRGIHERSLIVQARWIARDPPIYIRMQWVAACFTAMAEVAKASQMSRLADEVLGHG